MKQQKMNWAISVLLVALTFATLQWPLMANADSSSNSVDNFSLPQMEPRLSVDGNAIVSGFPVKAIIRDPNPSEALRRIPAPAMVTDGLDKAASATFQVTYVPNGGYDAYGERCYTYPQAAKNAFGKAAQIWGSILQSPVPITIRACWASIAPYLGYSGSGSRRNFSGAPRNNTWYNYALANALHGSDLDPGEFDMHITYDMSANWYFGTDGNTPFSQTDFVSVILHEVAHGLNFSGSMRYASGVGYWGGGTGYPNIYDTFVRDGSGRALLNNTYYSNYSAALGAALRSNNLWFHGAMAMAANGGARVRIYAPSTWASGSSYSHLDYNTFNNTQNQLMVYAISNGESIHDPGPVTKGLLKDLGWGSGSTNPPLAFLPLLLSNSDDAYEENDTRVTAWVYPGGYPAGNWERIWLSSIAGLGIQKDDDWYKIWVSPGYQRVLIDCRFTHAQGDIDIALYDSSGNWKSGSISVTDNEFIDFTVPTGGTYYIRVYFGNKGNTYDLWWDDI